MLKPSDNPPMVYPEGLAIPQFQGQWWVAHTKSRNEKALAQDLRAQEIHYFLPMTLNIRKYKDRSIKTILPVFTGYLFFCGDEYQRVEVLRTNRVSSLIDVADQGRLVGELAQVEQALRSGVPLVPHQYMREGQWCRVIAGPLLGLEGIVVRVKNMTRLLLQIEMLGQATSMEIDIHMIEPIDAPTAQSGPVITS